VYMLLGIRGSRTEDHKWQSGRVEGVTEFYSYLIARHPGTTTRSLVNERGHVLQYLKRGGLKGKAAWCRLAVKACELGVCSESDWSSGSGAMARLEGIGCLAVSWRDWRDPIG
jgi:hypothetical protein